MLKIVYPICCGLDVHKDFVYACIATSVNGVTTYKSHRFSTFTKGIRELLSWLLEHNCKDVCMESTGKYWIPVYNILETDCKIVLAHPKYVKAIRGKKTDKKDAKWIKEVAEELGVSVPYAYKLIRELNKELRKTGCITIAGRIDRKFFHEKFYGTREPKERRESNGSV